MEHIKYVRDVEGIKEKGCASPVRSGGGEGRVEGEGEGGLSP